ncbi:MAG: ABC-F family ATP-binding cassette domain-containing protein [Lentisphaerae bacterium]|nr:ABC-F family ATP-binding cassette domain-containing protein [Lentisphaerota bacterium]
MITFLDVTKRFAGQTVLENASFQVNPGEHVGVVGPNGAGKSTVFNLIVGAVSPDGGTVQTPSACRIGYVHQQIDVPERDGGLLHYVEHALPELHAIRAEMHTLESALQTSAAGDAAQERLRRLGELQHRFEALGGYALRPRAEKTLGGLGFDESEFGRALRTFSGGWQSRAELARVLTAEPDILLLDEPSNYLDIPAIEWLQRFLREFKGALMLISHDRYLLNSLTAVTLEVAHGRIERYTGCYDRYVGQRGQRDAQRAAALKNQQRKREQLERFIERFRAKNTRAAQVQSRIKQLERMPEIDVPSAPVGRGTIRLHPPPHCGLEVVRLDEAGVTYDGSRWVLRGLNLSIRRGEKTALVGRNGLGKTTLLRVLAGHLSPSEGRRKTGHKVVVGYQSQDFAETMPRECTVYETVKRAGTDCTEQEVRTLLGGFGFSGPAVEKRVAILSGGEKIRLAFARLLIRPPNFLVLDEPTTHLDIQAREALESALCDYRGTLCLVSHDIDFVRRVATGILAMTPPGVTRYAGGYDYYREKTAARAARAPVPTPSGLGRGKPDDRKERRRRRARARQERQARTRQVRQRMAQAEHQIAVFEREKTEVLERLAAPDVATDFAGLNRRLKTLQEEIEHYTQLWDEAAAALEAHANTPPPEPA